MKDRFRIVLGYFQMSISCNLYEIPNKKLQNVILKEGTANLCMLLLQNTCACIFKMCRKVPQEAYVGSRA